MASAENLPIKGWQSELAATALKHGGQSFVILLILIYFAWSAVPTMMQSHERALEKVVTTFREEQRETRADARQLAADARQAATDSRQNAELFRQALQLAPSIKVAH